MFQGISKAIIKSTGGVISKAKADEVAERMYMKLSKGSGDPDVPTWLDLEVDAEEYLEEATTAFFNEKTGKTAKELEDEFGLLSEPEDFQSKRGYTPEETEQYSRFLEMQERVDPHLDILSELQGELTPLRDGYLPFKNVPVRKARKSNKDEVAHYLGSLALERARLTEGYSAQSPRDFGHFLIKKLSGEDEYRESIQELIAEFPKRIERHDPLPEAEREIALDNFLEKSKIKHPVYRITHGLDDRESDIRFATPNELGPHYAQSRGTPQSLMGLLDENTASLDGEDRIFQFNMQSEDGGLPVSQVVYDDYYDKLAGLMSYPGEEMAKNWNTVKGYVRVVNPFVLNDFQGDLDLGGRLTSLGDAHIIYERAKEQTKKPFTMSHRNAFEEIKNKAIDTQLKVSEALRTEDKAVALAKDSIRTIRLNKDLQRWLESLGFDAVVYENKVDAPLEGDTKLSYILFKPSQFKTAWATRFDAKDPRMNYSEGGMVETYPGETTQPSVAQLNYTPEAMSMEHERTQFKHGGAVRRKVGISDEDISWAEELGISYGEHEQFDGKGDAARHLALGWLASRSKAPRLARMALNLREVTDPAGRMDVDNNNLGFVIKAETKKEAERKIRELVDNQSASYMEQEESRKLRGY